MCSGPLGFLHDKEYMHINMYTLTYKHAHRSCALGSMVVQENSVREGREAGLSSLHE